MCIARFVLETGDFKDKVCLTVRSSLKQSISRTKYGPTVRLSSKQAISRTKYGLTVPSSLKQAIPRTTICVRCVILYLVVYLQDDTTLDHSFDEDGKTI